MERETVQYNNQLLRWLISHNAFGNTDHPAAAAAKAAVIADIAIISKN
jgi:hypothetical protein